VTQGSAADRNHLVALTGHHPLALKMVANLVRTYHGGDAAAWRTLEGKAALIQPPPGREQEEKLWRIYGWYDQALTPAEKGLMTSSRTSANRCDSPGWIGC